MLAAPTVVFVPFISDGSEMCEEKVEELKKKRICSSCVGENYLSEEISELGKRRKCSYCGNKDNCYSVGKIAKRVEMAFEQHCIKTPDQPDAYKSMLMADPELGCAWVRDGDPVVEAIAFVAGIPDAAAGDVQRILSLERDDRYAAEVGEETEFSDGSHYERAYVDHGRWHEEWKSVERSVKSEARFFSRRAERHLSAIFDGIDEMRTPDHRPLVIDAGPATALSAIYRARVFQSDETLKSALCRPDTQPGSPPPNVALAGRMNAQGISVFYGAGDPHAAIAEVRAPVGSQVAVAHFEIIRNLCLLDLTALKDVSVDGSDFDVELSDRMEHASFLRSLSERITQPVMPDDEPIECLVTQAIADCLATESSVPLDGIVYPSVQVAGSKLNVVLFHKAARVEVMDIPEGTEIHARTERHDADGWEEDFAVIEWVPPARNKPIETDEEAPSLLSDHAGHVKGTDLIWENPDTDRRESSLRVMPDSIQVHKVTQVDVKTREFPVSRNRHDLPADWSDLFGLTAQCQGRS